MPKLNLHLDTSKEIDFDTLQWNDSLLAKKVDINRKQQKTALKLILCNVVKYRDKKLLYSRNHERKKPPMHNPHQLSNKTIYNVIDKLTRNGLAESIKGDKWFTKDREDTHLSVFKAKQPLIDLADSLGLTEDKVEEAERSYLVLRDDRNNIVEHETTLYSLHVQRIMHEISNYLNEQSITYQGQELTPFHLQRKYRDYDNSKEFKWGGRCSEPYMSLSSEERGKILINGKPTKSFDYSASLTSLVYESMLGIPRKDVVNRVQPYGVLAIDRSVAKTYMNFMYNTTKTNFAKSINSYYNNPKRKQSEIDEHNKAKKNLGGINQIKEVCLELNEPISKYLLRGKKYGQHFSWMEANMTHLVQHYLCIHLEIPCLTVYDEFIVPADDYVEDYLYTVGFPDEYESYYTELLKKGV